MPPNQGDSNVQPPEMNKVGIPTVKNDSSAVKKKGCCKSCTDKIILTLENLFEK